MGMQNFIKIYQKVQGIGPVSHFSEFEPRQNLDLSQISFVSLIGYILSISMCMQISSQYSSGERGGSVVECRTPEREIGGSIPTAAVLCL